MKLPKNLSTTLNVLHKAGFTAYLAGGAVRDMILGKEPKDYDIATSAKPDQVIDVLEKAHIHFAEASKKYGTIVVIFPEHETYEVTTFRKEGPYSDGRRPDFVEFVSDKQDALRRDFTINGLFYDSEKDEVIDYVDGQKDLKAQVIRFIGEPKKRIEEDHLRILRYVRLKHVLRFNGDPASDKAARESAKLIDHVSWERIRDEFHKAFLAPKPDDFIRLLDEYHLLKILLPEVKAMQGVIQGKKYHSEGDAYVHTLLAMSKLPPSASIPLVWATILHDIGKTHTQNIIGEKITFYGHESISTEMSKKIVKRFKLSSKMADEILFAVSKHMLTHKIGELREGKRIALVRDRYFPTLLELYYVDLAASVPEDPSVREKDYEKKTYIQNLYGTEKSQQYPTLITGEDLKKLGFKPGPKFKEILKEIEILQMEKKISTKQEALDFIKKNRYKV